MIAKIIFIVAGMIAAFVCTFLKRTVKKKRAVARVMEKHKKKVKKIRGKKKAKIIKEIENWNDEI